MRWAALIVSVWAVCTSSPVLAEQNASVKDLAAKTFVEVCLTAQKTGEADISRLPENAGKLGPSALKQLGLEPDTFAVVLPTADSPLILNLTGNCSVMTTKGGGRPFLDAVLAKAVQAGFSPELESEADNPKSAAATTALYVAPIAGKTSAAIVATYSKEGAKPENEMFYISVFGIRKN
jgi:hypothetical protein